MENKLDFFPADCRELYYGNTGHGYPVRGLVVKYLKDKRIDFGHTDGETLSEEQRRELKLFKALDIRSYLEIHVLEQDDYIIYMLSMHFGYELGKEPDINAYLPKFQSQYLPALERQVNLPIDVILNSDLQVLFVYDKNKACYCSFEQFNADREQKISQVHLEATVYKRGMLALGWKSQILALGDQLDRHFCRFEYYTRIAMRECMGCYDSVEQEDDETDIDYGKRRSMLESEVNDLRRRIKEFNLYPEDD